MTDLPLPDLANPLTAPFWQAAREHRLVVQRCGSCHALQWPPKPVCTSCLSALSETDWGEVRPTGEIWSFVVYHRAFHPGFKDRVPYNVAMIRLDDGPMFITNITGTNDVTIGQRVTAAFEAVTPEVTLVRFERID